MKILLTGGYGRLGTELRKLRRFSYVPTQEELDITKKISIPKNVDLIVHCAAYTNVEGAEKERKKCYAINVEGTRQLSFLGLPIFYISTEYVFDGYRGNYKETDPVNPINYYSLTKLLGEETLNKYSKSVRVLFKPRPFPHPRAFVDQWTSGDYIDIMAKEINFAIEHFEKLPRIMHIGTGRKSIYEMAKKTAKVEPMSRTEITKVIIPKDVSLNIDKWIKFKKENKK